MEVFKWFNPYVITIFFYQKDNYLSDYANSEIRTVKWYELELITFSENGTIFTEGELIPAKAGDIFIRTPGMKVSGQGYYKSKNIIFDYYPDKKLGKYYASPCYDNADEKLFQHISKRDTKLFENIPYKLHSNDLFHVNGLYDEMFGCFVNDQFNEYPAGKALLFELVKHIFELNEYIDKSTQQMHKIKMYIKENCTSNLNLKELADMCYMSSEHFCRVFKKSTGISPMQFTIRCRISKAKKLLLSTQMSIEEISDICGYVNKPFFYKTFKKIEGITPSNFRKYYSN